MMKTCALFLTMLLFSLCCKAQSKLNDSGLNSCTLSSDMAKGSALILNGHLKAILGRSQDSCNLKLTDSVINYFVRNKSLKSYNCLVALSLNVDGSLTDYFVEKFGRIYKADFGAFFEFLYADYKSGRKQELSTLIVEYWSNLASMSKSPKQTIKEIRSNTHKKIKSTGNLSNKNVYLEILLKKIDPNYLD